MSTTIGKRMIDGAGVKYHTVGSGFVRDVAGNVFEFVGNLGVKKGAQLIRGHGYRITGEGKKKKAGRPKKKKC